MTDQEWARGWPSCSAPRIRAGEAPGGRSLQRSLRALSASGAPSLSLVVTDGNPARRLYDSLGFTRRFSSLSVVLPARTNPTMVT